MSLSSYLKNHLIVFYNFDQNPPMNDEFHEVIVDTPKELIEHVLESSYYIPEILWWDRVHISTQSHIGYGGTRDLRDPDNYYFAETDICKSFKSHTTLDQYIEYIDWIKKRYAAYDMYPSFDICKIENNKHI